MSKEAYSIPPASSYPTYHYSSNITQIFNTFFSKICFVSFTSLISLYRLPHHQDRVYSILVIFLTKYIITLLLSVGQPTLSAFFTKTLFHMLCQSMPMCQQYGHVKVFSQDFQPFYDMLGLVGLIPSVNSLMTCLGQLAFSPIRQDGSSCQVCGFDATLNL